MEWDTGMEPDFDDLLEVICPPVHNNELYDFILDVTSYQQWTPSPFPQTSDGITQMVGQLDINKEKTAQTALKSDKRRVRNDQEERPRGRPRKPVLPSEMARRQKAANGRERKRMLELTRLFNELKQCLPTNVLVKSKKEILIQAIEYIDKLRFNNANC